MLIRPEGVSTSMFVINVILAVGTALVGMVCIGASTTAYFVTNDKWYERILLFIAGVTLIHPGIHTDIFGIVVLGGVWFLQTARVKRKALAQEMQQ